MPKNDVLQIMKDVGAVLKGHFILSSGKHAEDYIQCALLFRKPPQAEKVCSTLSSIIPKPAADTLIVSPAMGGIIFGYELARHMGLENVFVERTGGTQFTLRRGFSIAPGQPCIIAEDVVTTGASTREVMNLLETMGGRVISVACIVNRSGLEEPFGPNIPLYSLLSLKLETYEANALPPHLAQVPAVKHGSRMTP